MAINFLDNLDLNDNQLLNARLQNLASDPTSANAGDIIFNTTSGKLKYYDGTSPFSAAGWIDPSAGTYTGWTITGDSGTTANVTSGAGVVFVGGLGMTTSSNGFNLSISLDEATATTRGGIELFSNTDQSVAANTVSATASRTYGLQLNSSGQGVVNVPWTDTSGMSSWTVTADSGGSIAVGDGQTVDWAGGTGITTAYSTPSGNRTVTITNSQPFDSLTLASSTGSSSTISNSGTITLAAGAGITTTNNASGTVTIAATGTDTTYTLPVTSGSNTATATLTGSDGSTDTVQFAGTTNETTVANLASGNITIGLPDNVTLGGDLTVGGGNITLSGTGRVQGIDTVTDATDAVNKSYVDNAVVGNLIFQGGYDAANNTPNLDGSPPVSGILKGWSYVVTVAGSFFTEVVEVGDFLIAQQDAPTALANWVTVQNNVGLATGTTVGIGNVEVNSSVATAGMAVAYSAGTASIGWSIKNLSVISNAIVDADRMAILDMTGFEQKAIELSTLKTYFQAGLSQGFAGTSSSGTTHTFNHNLNTYDVIVQVYDASNYETVYATVDRTSVNQVVVTTAASANLRCLINNVG